MALRAPPLRSVIAGNIRRLRLKRGLTQQRLAELAGLHPTYVGMVERCESSITVEVLDALASALAATASELVSDPAEDNADPT